LNEPNIPQLSNESLVRELLYLGSSYQHLYFSRFSMSMGPRAKIFLCGEFPEPVIA
jgi:hypothetical protein